MTKPKKYLPLTDEELAKSVAARKRLVEPDFHCTPEEYALAELGMYFGWQAVRDVLDNKVSTEDFQSILNGGRKVWYSQVYDIAMASVAAYSAPKTKHPTQTFQAMMNHYTKNMKVDK